MDNDVLAGKSCVYGLFDPAEQIIRYVGQSSKPRLRLSSYATIYDNPNTYYVTATKWLHSFLKQGRRPCMFMLDVCWIEEATITEFFWYQNISLAGVEIFNKAGAIQPARLRGCKRHMNEYLPYKQFAVLEPGSYHTLYLPETDEYKQKFSGVLSFVLDIQAKAIARGTVQLGAGNDTIKWQAQP